MHTMKKHGFCYALVLLFCLSTLAPSVLAMSMQPRASNYIKVCSATVVAAGSGKISVSVVVSGIGNMTQIGATKIVIEQSASGSVVWTAAKTYYSSSVSAMLSSGASYSKTPVTYQGTKGYRYRAVVTCYAANGSGSDSKACVSSPITAT